MTMLDPIKLAHFRNLVSLSAADGKVEELERVALAKIAYENDIPLDRLNVMLERANEYKYLIPQDSSEKEKQLDDMIRLALVDGEFSPAERELINTVSEKLGFSPSALEKLIDTALSANSQSGDAS
jgi:uncharacterized tellurite resistance protein B-like protein